MLLRCCLIYITIVILRHTLYLSLLVSMSRPNSVHVLSFRYIFHFQPHFHCHYTSSLKQTHLFLYIFQNISYYFWITTWMKMAHNFQKAKVQPQGAAQLLLNFLPGVAYKKRAYFSRIQLIASEDVLFRMVFQWLLPQFTRTNYISFLFIDFIFV